MADAVTGRSDVGSAAEEAAKLFAAMEDWARTRAGTLLDDEHLATGSPECRVCPLCQVVGALRHVRPEAVEHLLDAAASLVAAVRSATTPEPGEASRPAGPRVERINVQEP